MATYIQGLTDYIPQIQPFQPDYNFLSNVLQTKQSRYDSAHKQLSGLYGTMLNAPMLREQNIQARDEFFKAIDQDIQRMSGLDLSLQQNVDAAQQVFKGLYEDKNIVKDMTWTKNYFNQLEKAEGYKSCVDPEKCGGSWWEGGVKLLNYAAQDFKNASEKEALGFSDPEFVAAQNITEKAIKAAKDAGFSVKYDKIQGDWIVHTKNGTEMIQPLAEFYVAKFGSDPSITAFTKAQATLQRRDWVSQNLSRFNNDEFQANLAYISEITPAVKNQVEANKKDSDQVSSVMKAKSEQIDKHIAEKGYIPSLEWLLNWKDSKDEAVVAESTQQVYKKSYDDFIAMGYNKDNIKFLLESIDNNVGLGILKQSSLVAASAYSSLTAEQTFDANPFAVQARQQAFEMQKQSLKEGYIDPRTGRFVPGTDYYNKAEILKLEKQQEEAIQDKVLESLDLKYRINPEMGGTATDVFDKAQAYNSNQQAVNQVSKNILDNQKSVVNLVLSQAQLANKTSKADARVIEGMIVSMIGTDSKSGINAKKLIAGDAEEVEKFNQKLNDPNVLGRVYSVAADYTNPISANGALNQGWLGDIKSKVDSHKTAVSEDVEVSQALRTFTKKQGDLATKTYLAELIKDGKRQEAQVFSEMYKQLNVDGFPHARTGVAEQQRIAEAAKKYAEKNKHLFVNAVDLTQPLSQDPLFDAAYNAAINVWKGGEVGWKTAYASKSSGVSSWDNPKGGKAAGKRTAAFSTNIDAIARNSEGGRDFIDLMNNYQALGNQAIVKFGTLSQNAKGDDDVISTDPTAKAILDTFYPEFLAGAKIDKNGVISDKNRARAEFDVSAIAASDPNLLGFRIVPSESWAEKHMSTEKTEKTIPFGDDRYKDGIVVYLPKDKVGADFVKRTTWNKYDFLMAMNGKVSYSNPVAGEVTLQRVGDMYQLTTIPIAYDAQGNKVTEGKVTMHNLDLNIEGLMSRMKHALSYQELENLQQLNAISGMNRRNPNEVFKQ